MPRLYRRGGIASGRVTPAARRALGRGPRAGAWSPDHAPGPTEGLPAGSQEEAFGRAGGTVRRPFPSAYRRGGIASGRVTPAVRRGRLGFPSAAAGQPTRSVTTPR